MSSSRKSSPTNNTSLRSVVLSILETHYPAKLTTKKIIDIIDFSSPLLYSFAIPENKFTDVSSVLSTLCKSDNRIARDVVKGNKYEYYWNLSPAPANNHSVTPHHNASRSQATENGYSERDLHKILSTYLSSESIRPRTINHKKTKKKESKDMNWMHPDMVGIRSIVLSQPNSDKLFRIIEPKSTFEVYSYEIKKEISNDTDLKESYFQAVSNSSWANYGYLVAFMYSDKLNGEMARLCNTYGIGFIQLSCNPWSTKILFRARYRELDHVAINKLCENDDFNKIIGYLGQVLEATNDGVETMRQSMETDDVLKDDNEAREYCRSLNIPCE